MDPSGVIQLVFLIILIILSAFFSSAETAFTTVNVLSLKERAENNSKRAVKALKLIDNKSKLLSAVLILNNVVNLSASALTTTLAMKLFGSAYIAAATGILTFILLIFGEVTPKTIATIKSEMLTLAYAPAIYALVTIITPIVFVIDKLSMLILRILKIDPADAHEAMTEYELRSILDVSHEDGVIETEEKEMIYNVVDFGDSCAKDIMIPRVEMSSINVNAEFGELKEMFFDKKYTRLPVYEESTDNIIGLINMKDFLFYDNYEGFSIRSLMREPSFTFEYKKTSDLLLEMREKSIPMIFVLDEYGATVGLVTLEDLLEEIVGEIRDEYDEDEANLIQKISDTEYRLDGSLKLDDINDALDTDLDSAEYDSIGGLIIEKLDHIPENNESVEIPDKYIRLIVENIDKNHIESVLMQFMPKPVSESEAAEAGDDAGSTSEAAQ